MCFNFHTEIVVCSDLTLTNGNIVYNAGSPNNRPFSSKATYSCMTGYTLTGGSWTRLCLSRGRWSGLAPTCQGEFCNSTEFAFVDTGPTAAPPTTCSDLTNPTNGMISYNMGTTGLRPVNTVATYTCDTGYTLNGGSTRTCGSDGMWSGANPVYVNVNDGMWTILLLSVYLFLYRYLL